MSKEISNLLNVYIKEYEATRSEIILRLKEKNTIVRYMILLVSAVIVGIWKAQENMDQIFLMLVLLLIIPFISILLTFIHNWHDEMIVTLGSYIQKKIRPRINKIFKRSDLLEWDMFLDDFRKKFGWKTRAIFMRLIFVAPIPISVIGYLLIKSRPSEIWIEITLISIDLLFLLWIVSHFILIDRKYRLIKE